MLLEEQRLWTSQLEAIKKVLEEIIRRVSYVEKLFAIKRVGSITIAGFIAWVTEVVSGKKKEHDRKLGRLLKSLKKGDILIVTELSRLSRTLLDIMSILHRCLEMNITVYSTKDGYAFDNSINSKVLAFAFALVAEIEHNLISMRTKEALAHRKSEGVRLGRPPGKGKQNVLLDNREEISHLLEEGMSVSAVCRIYHVSRETFYAVNRKYQLF